MDKSYRIRLTDGQLEKLFPEIYDSYKTSDEMMSENKIKMRPATLEVGNNVRYIRTTAIGSLECVLTKQVDIYMDNTLRYIILPNRLVELVKGQIALIMGKLILFKYNEENSVTLIKNKLNNSVIYGGKSRKNKRMVRKRKTINNKKRL